MATSTKEALAAALRQMMTVKPIDKVTVKDIVEICGVNRQTFYYHFDDVDDLLEWVFEQDSDRVFPQEVVYNHWMEDMMNYFDYLVSNSAFTLNVYNSNSRLYMLRYLKARMAACIRSFAEIASEGKNIDRQDFEFVVEFYANCAIGFISQWMDMGMDGYGNAVPEGDHTRADSSGDGPEHRKHTRAVYQPEIQTVLLRKTIPPPLTVGNVESPKYRI